jgi:hypothetical protein
MIFINVPMGDFVLLVNLEKLTKQEGKVYDPIYRKYWESELALTNQPKLHKNTKTLNMVNYEGRRKSNQN